MSWRFSKGGFLEIRRRYCAVREQVPVGVTKQDFHGFARLLCVAGLDRTRNGGMVRQVAGEDADGDVEDGAQDRIDCAAKAAQHRVMCGLENGEVKSLV